MGIVLVFIPVFSVIVTCVMLVTITIAAALVVVVFVAVLSWSWLSLLFPFRLWRYKVSAGGCAGENDRAGMRDATRRPVLRFDVE
jgi:hypothetical protein